MPANTAEKASTIRRRPRAGPSTSPPPWAPPSGGTASAARLVAAAGFVVGVLVVPARPAAAEALVTARVSQNTVGAQADNPSFGPAVTADGGVVAFSSLATTLVAGDTNNASDVFVNDWEAGTTTRVSVSSDGTEANGGSGASALSGDGRLVAFSSFASNLVAGDTNAATDIFLHDRQAGTTTRVSVRPDGGEGDGDSTNPAMSADGRFVAFDSPAANLVAGDSNGSVDIFVHDRHGGSMTRVSVASDGSQGNGDSTQPALSADARFVAFQSLASNLVLRDTNGYQDVFVHDRDADANGVFDEAGLGKTASTRASVDSTGLIEANAFSLNPALSPDGTVVSFESTASNLVPGDKLPGVFVHDRKSHLTTKVATGGAAPALSADGGLVAYAQGASRKHVFVYDRQAGTATKASVASDGTEANNDSFRPAISGDGMVVSFESMASNLVASDTNGVRDIFTRGPARPSFSLSASPASQTVVAGDTTSYAIDITTSGGFADPVSLSVAGLPDGVTASFDPNPATTSSTLSVQTATTTAGGDYPLTISGTAGTLSRATTVTLSLRTDSFSIAASPASQHVVAGDTTSYAIDITTSGGFADPVSLSVDGLPDGVTASFDPNPATSSSTLSVHTATTTAGGDYRLTISGTGGGLTRTTGATLSVTALPSLSVDDVTVTEGAPKKTTKAVFSVSLSAPGDKTVSVDYVTADDTATAPDDYAAKTGTLKFPAGAVSKTIAVSIKGDGLDEADETFVLKLSNPKNATVADGQGVGTIADDDPAPALSINDVAVTEGNAGTTTNVVFAVKLSAPSGRTVSVSYGTADGTAVAPGDYTAVTGAVLTFSPGETTKYIAVFVNGDDLDEANETFFVNLTSPINASLADGQGRGTITNDD